MCSPLIRRVERPDIRRTLVRDALTIDPGTTGLGIVQYLNSNWSPVAGVDGDLIGSTDVLAVIQRQAGSLDTWQLSPRFEEKNPQFAHCRATLFHSDD